MNRSRLTRLIALALLLAVGIAVPFVAASYYVVIATLILASAMLASSVNLLAGDAGLFSLGHAGIAAASGYGLAWAARQGLDNWTQLAVAAGLTLLTSAVYGAIAMRTTGIFFLMVTLAAGMIVYGMAYRWSSVTGGNNGLSGIRRPDWFSQDWQFYFVVLVAFVVVTLALRQLSGSSFGLRLRGIRDSESRMRSLGYSNAATKFVAMMLSGVVAGIAGVLLVWQSQFISPPFAGFQPSALALVMVVLGGVGRTFGPLIGATVVILIQQVLSSYIERWTTVLGVLFIVVVVVSNRNLVPRILQVLKRPRTESRDKATTNN